MHFFLFNITFSQFFKQEVISDYLLENSQLQRRQIQEHLGHIPQKLFVVTAIPKSIIAIPDNSILIPFIANTFVTNLNLPSAHIKYINSFTCKLCCANSSNIINIFRKFSSTGIHSSKTA